MKTSFTAVHPADHPTPAGNYSPAILIPLDGDRSLLFISGQVAKDSAGNPVAVGDPAGQTEAVFDCLESILVAAGGTVGDLVSLVIHLVDMAHFSVVSPVRNSRLGSPPPTSTLVETSRLARPEFLVEVSGVALLSGSR
jgi:enamine deaminase RidA (YjgF/YER057c/UK114 family)